jgi:lipoprotein-anchoring transpeptidase ErfK/SrfK
MSPGVPRAKAREMVALSGYASGTIVVRTTQRRLYYVDDR